MKLMTHLTAFIRDEEGQDLIEYALLVALISIVAVLALTDVGTEVKQIFTDIASDLQNRPAPE